MQVSKVFRGMSYVRFVVVVVPSAAARVMDQARSKNGLQKCFSNIFCYDDNERE